MTAAEEAAAQAELLENVIATAQRLVKAEKDKSRITPAFIAEKVQLAATMWLWGIRRTPWIRARQSSR